MVVADAGGGTERCYLVPMTYRAAPLAGAEEALIGTTEHGVLGLRYVYDGARDPVLAAQLGALLQGEVGAQAQGVSNTPDPSVTASYAGLPLSRPIRRRWPAARRAPTSPWPRRITADPARTRRRRRR